MTLQGHEALARAVVGLSALAGLYRVGQAEAAERQAEVRLAEARTAFLAVWPQLAPRMPVSFARVALGEAQE